MRCLITDILFPTKYSKWRLVEIHYFINKYDTDILVINKTNNYRDTNFKFDYDELKNKFDLSLYDILIFNPKYNFINNYNDNYDGTIFNNIIKCDYLFRKKKFRDEQFCINNYNFVYHIFLMNYTFFNNIFNYNMNKQFIHLYPGGGVTTNNIENMELIINKDVNLITTQEFISKHITRKNKIDIFCGGFFYENEICIKPTNKDKLTICFTCMANYIPKGGLDYIKIVSMYKNCFYV